MQPINYKCDKCINWLIYCDQEPLWLLTLKMIAILGGPDKAIDLRFVSLGLFAKYFSTKSFSLSLKVT